MAARRLASSAELTTLVGPVALALLVAKRQRTSASFATTSINLTFIKIPFLAALDRLFWNAYKVITWLRSMQELLGVANCTAPGPTIEFKFSSWAEMPVSLWDSACRRRPMDQRAGWLAERLEYQNRCMELALIP